MSSRNVLISRGHSASSPSVFLSVGAGGTSTLIFETLSSLSCCLRFFSRTLKNEGSTVSHGTLRGFFEIMKSDYAQLHPPYTLASSEPDEYQLRVS